MPSQIYLEEQADTSPTTASFSNTQSSVSCTYRYNNPTFDQLRLSIIDLLGFTDARSSDGRIKRTLPARHPAYQWMFADSASPQGVGAAFTNIQPSPGRGSSIVPDFPLYADYHYRVTFSPRPYQSWQDRDIQIQAGTFFPKSDQGSGGPAGTAFKAATEWWRFTTFDLYPTNQFASAQLGQMLLRVNGGAAPNNFVFQDAPRMYLPDSILKVRWFEVPYRYLMSPNSYLRKFVGHVNQDDFSDVPNANPAPFPKGSLLYLGATPVRVYQQLVPDEGLLAFNNNGNNFTRSRLCDLELNFLYTARTAGASAPSFATVNRNWITAGHNLLPWLTDRKFYYGTSYDPSDATNQSKWWPTYNSFPAALYFTDPDVATSPKLDP